MIVVDASVIVTALADDGPAGQKARTRLRGERLVAPHVVDLEVLSAWRRLVASNDLEPGRVALAIADLRALPIERMSHGPILERCWGLRDNITVYDAAYVALAEVLDATLVTADAKLTNAPGAHCQFEIVQ